MIKNLKNFLKNLIFIQAFLRRSFGSNSFLLFFTKEGLARCKKKTNMVVGIINFLEVVSNIVKKKD